MFGTIQSDIKANTYVLHAFIDSGSVSENQFVDSGKDWSRVFDDAEKSPTVHILAYKEHTLVMRY